MFCPKCGKENAPGIAFCAHCGAPQAQGGPPPLAAAAGGPPYATTPAGGAPAVPNYLVQAILVTLCCCLPFGVVSIVFAAQVNGKLAAGDYAGAQAASKNAKLWAWIGFGLGLAGGLLYAVFVGIAAVFGHH